MYLVFDTETGGIPKEVTLLTAWFGVYDEKFELLRSLDLRLKPDNGLYVIEPKSLEINNIDLASHDKVAISYKEAKGILYKFLNEAYKQCGLLTPVGHGVMFDINKVTENLISRGSWETFVSYRTLDTGTIANFLRVAGIIPNEVEAGLSKLLAYYNITPQGELHTARADALATVEVLQYLIKEVRETTPTTLKN